MTRTHRRTATLLATTGLALGLGLGGLSACSQADPAPKFAEEPSASPTPKAKETAEEFIRRWARVQNEMQSEGDSTEYRKIVSDCESCLATADRIDGIYDSGGFVRTDGMTVRSIRREAATKRAETYTVVVDLAPTEYRESAQAAEQSLPGGRSTYSIVLGKTDESGWVFANYMKVPE